MQTIFAAAITVFIFLGIFLLAVSTDFKDVYRRLKRSAGESAQKLQEAADRESFFGKVINNTEIMIEKAKIRIYIGYNVWTHFFICIVSGALAFKWISRYLGLLTSLTFALVGALIPYVVLGIISDAMDKREKRNAVNFLIILKNFFRSGKNDIFEAFEKVIQYLNEPLKGYIELMVYEYNNKVNALACLGNFKQKLGTPELQLYIENLSICYVQGGDIVGLTDTFIQEMSNIDEEDDKDDTEDKLLNYGLYLLLALNFIVIWWMMNSAYKKEVMGSLWGQVVFVADMLVSIYIIYMSMKKV